MFDMYGVIYCEQRSMATKWGKQAIRKANVRHCHAGSKISSRIFMIRLKEVAPAIQESHAVWIQQLGSRKPPSGREVIPIFNGAPRTTLAGRKSVVFHCPKP